MENLAIGLHIDLVVHQSNHVSSYIGKEYEKEVTRKNRGNIEKGRLGKGDDKIGEAEMKKSTEAVTSVLRLSPLRFGSRGAIVAPYEIHASIQR